MSSPARARPEVLGQLPEVAKWSGSPELAAAFATPYHPTGKLGELLAALSTDVFEPGWQVYTAHVKLKQYPTTSPVRGRPVGIEAVFIDPTKLGIKNYEALSSVFFSGASDLTLISPFRFTAVDSRFPVKPEEMHLRTGNFNDVLAGTNAYLPEGSLAGGFSIYDQRIERTGRGTPILTRGVVQEGVVIVKAGFRYHEQDIGEAKTIMADEVELHTDEAGVVDWDAIKVRIDGGIEGDGNYVLEERGLRRAEMLLVKNPVPLL